MAYRMTGIMLYFLCDGGIQLCFSVKYKYYVFFFLFLGYRILLTVKFDCELERWWAIFTV